MFKVQFIKKQKIFCERSFTTRLEADDFVINEVPDYHCEYQIYDTQKSEIVDSGELEGSDDIIEGTMNSLFPDEESNEGFDIDDHFGID